MKLKHGIAIIGASVVIGLLFIILYEMAKNPSKTLRTGDFAPDFALKDQYDQWVKLSDYKGKKNVVLFFYPKDDTPGCTREACGFRDAYVDFTDLNAEVIGVSSDSVSSHIRFASKFRLPFNLCSDLEGKVREMYGISPSFFVIPGRVTFIIDKSGKIQHIFSNQIQATRHIDEALEVLKKLD